MAELTGESYQRGEHLISNPEAVPKLDDDSGQRVEPLLSNADLESITSDSSQPDQPLSSTPEAKSTIEDSNQHERRLSSSFEAGSTNDGSGQSNEPLLPIPDKNITTDLQKEGSTNEGSDKTEAYLIPKGAPNLRDMKNFALMLTSYVAAIIAAVAQHCFYRSLNGSDLDTFLISQVWVSQIGTALIFLFKTTVVTAVGFAYNYAFWHRVRRSAVRVGGLDAMYGVLANPFQFFSTDLLFRAKFLLILAIVSWTLPLSAIFAPGALTGQFETFQYLPNSNRSNCSFLCPEYHSACTWPTHYKPGICYPRKRMDSYKRVISVPAYRVRGADKRGSNPLAIPVREYLLVHPCFLRASIRMCQSSGRELISFVCKHLGFWGRFRYFRVYTGLLAERHRVPSTELHRSKSLNRSMVYGSSWDCWISNYPLLTI
jgi:hypothetical protein